MLIKINDELTTASVALQRDRNIHCITTQEMCKSILFILNNLHHDETIITSDDIAFSKKWKIWDENYNHSQKRIISRIKALELSGVIKLNTTEIGLLDNLYEYYNEES
jgi:hypothetical protein